jgi:signal transduction histidine kinase
MRSSRFTSRLFLAALGLQVGYQVLCIVSVVGLMTSPSGGWVFWETGTRAIRAEPVTAAAVQAASTHQAPLLLEGLNGHPVAQGQGVAQVRRLVDTNPAAKNSYVLRDAAGQQLAVTLAVDRPTPAAFGEGEGGGILSILYHLLGLGFLLVGVYYWWQRPADPAVRALLLFCLVAAFHMAEVHPHNQLSRLLLALNMAFMPLFAPAGLHLAVTYTSGGDGRLLRRTRAWLLAGASVIGVALFVVTYLAPLGYAEVELVRQGALAAASLTLVAATLLCFYTCWRVARSSASSLLQRLRAREMSKAMVVPFIIPSLWQLFRPHIASAQVTVVVEFAQLAALATFLVMVGNAIRLTEMADGLHRAQCRLMDDETQAVLTRFIAGIVHEINSPLGVLTSSAGTVGRAVEILGDNLPGGAPPSGRVGRRVLRSVKVGRESAQTMQAASGRIRALVTNLQRSICLDAAAYRALDLRKGLEDALQLLAPELEGRIALRRDLPQDEVLVSCYPARLNRILLSLLQNAVEAVAGRGEVSLTMRSEDEQVHFEIADTGRGIPAEKLATLFEFGFTRKTGRIGLGMGLPSSRRLVQQMSGDITVRSTVGQGTTVCLTLPKVCPRDDMAAAA